MQYTLRTYQKAAIEHATEFLSNAGPKDRKLYAAPTGTGKSLIELGIQANLSGCWIVTPRLEIVAGMVEKLTGQTYLSPTHLVQAAEKLSITTPTRFRNKLLKGKQSEPVSYLVIDESHHETATTYRQLHLLAGVPAVGFTATPFRASPRANAQLREDWGEPVWAITYPEAAAEGYVTIPECRVVPLLDDDQLEIAGGDFVVQAAAAATESRLEAIASLCGDLFCHAVGEWANAAMVSMPSRSLCVALAAILSNRGKPCVVVSADTPYADRQLAFANVVARTRLLIQVQVISEGVDLPIRTLVDCCPTLSPVRWLQQLGRITRPGGNSLYLCTNRNLLRHCYLLAGCLPPATIMQAQQAFPPSERSGYRTLGLEAVGKLRPIDLPLWSGINAQAYSFSAVDAAAGQVESYFVIVHPTQAEPIWAKRTDKIEAGGNRAYGKWQACLPPAELSGFASLSNKPVSEKQLAWWKRAATRHGLDGYAEPNRKNFQALPVLADLRIKL